MDVFKLAFETTMSASWPFSVRCCHYLLFPDLLANVSLFQSHCLCKDNQSLLGVGGLTLAYVWDPRFWPISSQLVNDEHWAVSRVQDSLPGCNRRNNKLGADWLYRIANSSQAASLQSGKCSAYSEELALTT